MVRVKNISLIGLLFIFPLLLSSCFINSNLSCDTKSSAGANCGNSEVATTNPEQQPSNPENPALTVSLKAQGLSSVTIRQTLYLELEFSQDVSSVQPTHFITDNLTVMTISGGPRKWNIEADVSSGGNFSIKYDTSVVMSGGDTKPVASEPVAASTAGLSVAQDFYADSAIYTSRADSAGNVYLGGSFTNTTQDLSVVGNIMVLDSNGSYKSMANYVNNSYIYKLERYADGRFFGFSARNTISRYLADGTLDATFPALTFERLGDSYWSEVNVIRFQSNGKFLVGGHFDGVNGTTITKGLKRFNADGTPDATWTATGCSSVLSCHVNDIHINSDGTVLVAGDITWWNGNTSASDFLKVSSAGAVDVTFNNVLSNGMTYSNRPNGEILAMTVKPNGKILLVGSFSAFGNGNSSPGIAQLSSTGVRDAAFETNITTGLACSPCFVRTLTNNQVLLRLVSWSESFNGVAYPAGIIRLNDNGTVDGTFAPPAAASNHDRNFWIMPNGDIELTSTQKHIYDSNPYRYISKLLPNGTLDPSFIRGTDKLNAKVLHLEIDGNGKLIVSGDFTSFGATSSSGLARLNADGTLDNTFNIGTGIPSPAYKVKALGLLKNGKYVISGGLSVFNGATTKGMAILNNNGTLDTSADFSVGFTHSWYLDVRHTVLSDGKILVYGSFETYQGVNKTGVFKLNLDGTIDSSFDQGTPPNGLVMNSCEDDRGRVILLGNFTQFNGQSHSKILRVNADGSIDSSFNAGTGITSTNSWAYDLACRVFADQSILVWGRPTAYNGAPVKYIFRLKENGELLPNFLADATSPAGIIEVPDPTFGYVMGFTATPSFTFIHGGSYSGGGYSGLGYRSNEYVNGVILNPF